MSFRFDEKQDKHPHHEKDEKKDDFAFAAFSLIARCLFIRRYRYGN